MNNKTNKTVGRPRVKAVLPSTGKFTLKSIKAFNKKVQRPVLVSRVREAIENGLVRVVGKVEKKEKTRGRRSFIYEIVKSVEEQVAA